MFTEVEEIKQPDTATVNKPKKKDSPKAIQDVMGLRLPPKLSGLPLVGSALEFNKDHNGLFARGYEELGSIFSFKLGPKLATVLIGPENQEVFFKETDTRLSMHKTYKFLKALFGDIAFAVPPETYFRQRPILHAPFKGGKMASYVQTMQEEVQLWLDSLPNEGEMEIISELTTLIQHIAAHCLMGKTFHEQMGDEFWSQFVDLVAALDPLLPPNLPLPKFFRRDKAKKKLNEMLVPIIEERRQNPENYDDFLQDFINSQYEDGEKVEDDIIIGMVLGLMFAGHETTLGQAAWGIIQLIQNPGYQALLQEEIITQFPVNTQVTGKVLRGLKHLQWAVDETSRMHPSADMLIRLAEVDLEIGGYRIPKDSVLFISPVVTQSLPEYFKNPKNYDPLRFSPERQEDKQHRFLMSGFGGGVHKCTGMNFAVNEMMVITALLFQQFDLSLVTENPTVYHGMGASKPNSTVIRYKRK